MNNNEYAINASDQWLNPVSSGDLSVEEGAMTRYSFPGDDDIFQMCIKI